MYLLWKSRFSIRIPSIFSYEIRFYVELKNICSIRISCHAWFKQFITEFPMNTWLVWWHPRPATKTSFGIILMKEMVIRTKPTVLFQNIRDELLQAKVKMGKHLKEKCYSEHFQQAPSNILSNYVEVQSYHHKHHRFRQHFPKELLKNVFS